MLRISQNPALALSGSTNRRHLGVSIDPGRQNVLKTILTRFVYVKMVGGY